MKKMAKPLYKSERRKKEASELQKATSSFTRKIKNLKTFQRILTIRSKYLKKQIIEVNKFLTKLVREGRITKEEMDKEIGNNLRRNSEERKKELSKVPKFLKKTEWKSK